MIDIKLIKEDPARIEAELSKRGSELDVKKLARLDGLRRKYQQDTDELRAKQKGIKDAASGKKLKAELKKLEEQAKTVEADFELFYLQLPNFSADEIPTEKDDEVRTVGKKPDLKNAQPHYAIPAVKPHLDFERGAKVSGSRFWFLKGPLVRIEFALIQYALDYYEAKGFTPMRPPAIVNEIAMRGTGFFPADANEIYTVENEHDKEDERKLYLSGTAEVPLASYHSGETLDELPVKYVGFAPAYRREAGSYGKDTKGIFRGHEFDKLELFVFSAPEKSWDVHEELQQHAEAFWTSLEVPFRTVNICTTELGAPNAKKYDIEAWLPGEGKYREVASNSNDTDFQARRLRIKHQGELVHTLNNTACAVGRTIIAIVENHQDNDGNVEIPQVLHQYLPFKRMNADGTTT